MSASDPKRTFEPSMRSLCFLILCALSNLATAQGIEVPCEPSPKEAVLSVPPPGDLFLHIVCTKYGHVLTPVAGWFWTQPGGYNPVFFPAQMVQRDPLETGNSVYFTSIRVKQLTDDAARAKWAVLAQFFPKDPAPDKALEITAENNSLGAHVIYIFPDAWGYSCSPTCRKENAFILINQHKERPNW